MEENDKEFEKKLEVNQPLINFLMKKNWKKKPYLEAKKFKIDQQRK